MCEPVLCKSDSGIRIPGVADVAGGAPGVAADFGSPLPNIGAAVLAKTVKDGAAGFEKSIAHFLIDGLHFFIGIEVAGSAPDRKSTRLNSSHANISYAVF